ncbi:hypothetical protein PybrP1_004165 [[Pythium] brassicae (nom. inval.)]|nr:hypothetical protein PybrP1_004165 [[Pythium] brassicae (nom. inval.)]
MTAIQTGRSGSAHDTHRCEQVDLRASMGANHRSLAALRDLISITLEHSLSLERAHNNNLMDTSGSKSDSSEAPDAAMATRLERLLAAYHDGDVTTVRSAQPRRSGGGAAGTRSGLERENGDWQQRAPYHSAGGVYGDREAAAGERHRSRCTELGGVDGAVNGRAQRVLRVCCGAAGLRS